MAAEVKILLEGYTNADQKAETGEERTRPTITLIRDKDTVIVVDPGILEERNMLVEALAVEGLTLDDVDFVCVTHSHIDHYKNIGIFPNAKVIEYYGIWDGDRVTEWRESFSPNIRIIKTPGHDYTGISLLVSTNEGVVAVCGDIFWRENSPVEPEEDMYASDPRKLGESRRMILKLADWIIPGHGPMFQVKDEVVAKREERNGILKKKSNGKKQCKTCRRVIENPRDWCLCRPWLCFRDCECGLDCDVCNCSHKLKR